MRDLPAHGSECMGCGSDNPAGLAMDVHQDGEVVTTEIVFDRRQVGAAGIVHGGAIVTACDDLFGFVLYVVGAPAVTRSLDVDFQALVRLDIPHRIRAWLDYRCGERLHMVAEGTDPNGTVCFSARAVFVVVPLNHLQRYGSPDHIFGGSVG